MKTKDIITLVIAGLFIIGSIVLGVKMLNPTPKNANQNTEAQNIKTISGEIDENTLKKIELLADYGKPNLDNIGKADLFANY